MEGGVSRNKRLRDECKEIATYNKSIFCRNKYGCKQVAYNPQSPLLWQHHVATSRRTTKISTMIDYDVFAIGRAATPFSCQLMGKTPSHSKKTCSCT